MHATRLTSRLAVAMGPLLLTVAGAAHAEAPAIASGGASGLMTMLLNLVLVLGIIGVCAFLYARGQNRFSVSNSELAIVASRQVGNRERLIVLQVGDEQVLLGITANSVSHLHTLSKPISAADTSAAPFAERLRQFSQVRSRRSHKT